MPSRIPYNRPDRAKVGRSIDQRERKRFYDSARWKRVRALALKRSPLCHDCLAADRTIAATHVHHDKPIEERPDLALDLDNLVTLCTACHTAREKRKNHNASHTPGGGLKSPGAKTPERTPLARVFP